MEIPERFELTEKSFAGGMSTAYVCRDKHLDRCVVVKSVDNPADVARLMDEIRALQRVRSPHVVEIYDVIVGATAREIALVEAYVDGPDLEAIVSGVPVAPSDWIKLMYQMASAVTDVHAQGVIHRDISPRNVKRGQAGFLKLFDFGLSRPVGPSASTVGYRGTPGFSAPELYSKGQVYFSTAADVYALGALGWFLASGELPDWLHRRSLDASVVAPEFSQQFTALARIGPLIDAALSINPDDRPAAEELLIALRRELLRDKHRALVISGSQSLELSDSTRAVVVGNRRSNYIVIEYDGYDFAIRDLGGDVSINNRGCSVGDVVDGACVIVLGGRALGPMRQFITFDVSYPEVSL